MRSFSVVITAALLTATCVAQTENDPTAGARGAAYTFAKKLITPALKNPRSAEFPWDSVKVEWAKKEITDDAEKPRDVVSVAGIVRATNSFNATVPQEWHIVMTHTDDLWEPAIVMLGEEIVFTSEAGKQLILQARKKADEKRRANMEAAQEKQKRDERLKSAFDAGVTAAKEAIVRNKWNRKVAAANVTKAAKKAAEASAFADDDEERARFLEGFESEVNTARGR